MNAHRSTQHAHTCQLKKCTRPDCCFPQASTRARDVHSCLPTSWRVISSHPRGHSTQHQKIPPQTNWRVWLRVMVTLALMSCVQTGVVVVKSKVYIYVRHSGGVCFLVHMHLMRLHDQKANLKRIVCDGGNKAVKKFGVYFCIGILVKLRGYI